MLRVLIHETAMATTNATQCIFAAPASRSEGAAAWTRVVDVSYLGRVDLGHVE